MMYKLKFTKEFEKDLKRLTAREQKAVANKLSLLVENSFHPSLRTKKVQGLENVFEMSVNMDIRIRTRKARRRIDVGTTFRPILWKYEDGIIILLIDVEHHKDILGV